MCLKLFNAAFLLFLLSCFLAPRLSHSQVIRKPTTGWHTGSQYLTRTNRFTSFRYTCSFSGTGSLFTTTYKLYHPTRGTHWLTITATHEKEAHKVVVEVADTRGSIFSQINQEETTYEGTPFTGFGFRGAVGGLFGKQIPNQLALQFTNRRAEYVKVLSVLGEHEGKDFEFFTLETETTLPKLPAARVLSGPRQQAAPAASATLPVDTPVVRIYSYVDQMPQIECGQQALNYFIYKNTHYPALADRNGLVGRVYVRALIDEAGQLGEPTIIKGLGSGCDEEALRVVRALPAFSPGRREGIPVRVAYVFVIPFAPRY